MTSESSPLLHYRLFSVSDGALGPPDSMVCGADTIPVGTGPASRKLSTFFGVVVPTVLSMFSIVVFMRIGFVIGHAGLLQSLLMLVVAYAIIWLTVLSVCAISTNGAVQGGGAYFMISRTLGPEFGGSIGLMFYLANVFACGVYVLGLVEAILDVFGTDVLSLYLCCMLTHCHSRNIRHLSHFCPIGGMKPNTVVFGFYDDSSPDDYFLQDSLFTPGLSPSDDPFGVDTTSLQAHFPPVRDPETLRLLPSRDYVAMICDALKMHKNVVLARGFPSLSRPVSTSSPVMYIDVWPLDLLRPQASAYVDVCSLFLLQMACILNMAVSWRRCQLRVFLCVESRGGSISDGASGWIAAEVKFRELLSKLRIRALIRVVAWDRVAAFRGPESEGQKLTREPISSEYLSAANRVVAEEGGVETAVRFLYLPRPPADSYLHERYLEELDALTVGLGPTLLIHGLTPVTCTEL
ncbi:hypothetical protein GDO86_011178 [Hymenochirus boettgeri]|uniref:Solute carrier family 12 member 9 n=1 Tax=Hymenochirus boettgeri TaxID=247094 RepID=A0A8T2JFC4_9PIPI|nr:hypothetical protein GDO86_011178 [Hymenochirus boettgeri]